MNIPDVAAIQRGEPLVLAIARTDPQTGAAAALPAGWVGRAAIKRLEGVGFPDPQTAPAATLDVSEASGERTLVTVSASVSATLSPGRYVVDLVYANASNVIQQVSDPVAIVVRERVTP